MIEKKIFGEAEGKMRLKIRAYTEKSSKTPKKCLKL